MRKTKIEPKEHVARVSVIIPVYNGEKVVGACLDALEGQTLPRDDYEIVVVDNGSTDQSANIAKQFPDVRVLTEPKPGSYAARNAGIAASRHPFLAFTDADCIPEPHWLEAGLRALKRLPNGGFVGGQIQFTFSEPKPSLIEQYDSLHYLNNEINVHEQRFAVTANMLTTRETLRRAGVFNRHLRSGGDREWGQRVTGLDMDCSYAPDALVKHAARNRLSSLIRKERRVVAGMRAFATEEQLRLDFTLSYLVPPLQRIRQTLADPEAGSLSRRLTLSGLTYFLKLVAFTELVKLQLGAEAERQ
jgi:glycosyltransferase involved in cell wall biosynthesis